MRRGEPPGGQAHLAQQPLDHPRGRRLAVGAGDVDDREGALGVAQQLHHRGDAVQRRLEVVLGGAGEDRLLDLPHPLAQVELLGGLALGRVRTTGHDCTPSVSAGAVAGCGVGRRRSAPSGAAAARSAARHPDLVGHPAPARLVVGLDEPAGPVEVRGRGVALGVGQPDLGVPAVRPPPAPWPAARTRCPGRGARAGRRGATGPGGPPRAPRWPCRQTSPSSSATVSRPWRIAGLVASADHHLARPAWT